MGFSDFLKDTQREKKWKHDAWRTENHNGASKDFQNLFIFIFISESFQFSEFYTKFLVNFSPCRAIWERMTNRSQIKLVD